MDAYLLVVIGGAVLAGFVQGLSGFAFALAALSVWSWAVDPQLAAPMAVFELGLGIFLLLYCPLGLFMPTNAALAWGGRRADAAAGWIGGVFGGIGGFAGAIPTLWCTLRGWDKDTQRGTMQAFNISMHVATLTGYVIVGSRIDGETLEMFAIIAPALAVPVIIGALLFRRLNQLSFRRIVLALLFLSGVALTGSSLGAVFG
jgi:uncharacterized membrane protein YfcA